MKYLLNNNLRILSFLVLSSVLGVCLHSTELEGSQKIILSNADVEMTYLNLSEDYFVSFSKFKIHYSNFTIATVSDNTSSDQFPLPIIVSKKQINNKYQELTGGQDVP